jgi:hypothetical protein
MPPDLCDHNFQDLIDWGLGIPVSVWSLSIRQALKLYDLCGDGSSVTGVACNVGQ